MQADEQRMEWSRSEAASKTNTIKSLSIPLTDALVTKPYEPAPVNTFPPPSSIKASPTGPAKGASEPSYYASDGASTSASLLYGLNPAMESGSKAMTAEPVLYMTQEQQAGGGGKSLQPSAPSAAVVEMGESDYVDEATVKRIVIQQQAAAPRRIGDLEV
jgi:hypothetical protein